MSKDALADINERVAPAGIEVLDLHAFVQVRCRCGVIYTVDFSKPCNHCECGVDVVMQVAFFAMIER